MPRAITGLLAEPLITAPRFGGVDMKLGMPQTGNPIQSGIGGLLRMFSNKTAPPPTPAWDPETDRLAAQAFGIPMGQPSAAPRRIGAAR